MNLRRVGPFIVSPITGYPKQIGVCVSYNPDTVTLWLYLVALVVIFDPINWIRSWKRS